MFGRAADAVMHLDDARPFLLDAGIAFGNA